MIPWTLQLLHSLTLWMLMAVLFLVGNEMGGSENTVSVFPTLLSPVALGVYVALLTRRFSLRQSTERLAAIVEPVIFVVLMVAVLMIPIASGYAFYYFEASPWQMVWSSAFMAFVTTFVVGFLVAWITAWWLRRSGKLQRGITS